MDFLYRIAEEKIREAMERGELCDLKGKGKPLELDDLSHVPEELRAGYRLLKNAGMVPEEVQLSRDISSLNGLLALCGDEGEHRSLQKELSVKRLRLQSLSGSRGWDHLTSYAEYGHKIREKLEGDTSK
ncbi:DnaJ family domain-containing protein [Paenibacillus herberti]|uniref:Molecular chaperone DnaJ n=1 Tax=Paenibacillus herberti TaxID=1619309 RepID=A0A229P1V7_9BACL|nr:DnaJ family domain-containing protein [Paenibacillus herberti]OXM16080.1 molecular chaperone DnaJ [Paenibacillus herberti]